MKFMNLTVLSVAALMLPTVADARQVSYPGGWTTMLKHNHERSSLHQHYSPTAKYSVGYKFEYWRDKDFALNALQLNNLLKRWNGPASQANLYLKSGIGVAYSNDGQFSNKTEPAGFTGLSADWEDRRYFVSYSNRYTEAGEIDSFYMQSGRVGIAPYVGDYGDLHTWLMLDVQHSTQGNDDLTFTPMVRFFKSVHMVEAGVTDDGDVMFNYTIRF